MTFRRSLKSLPLITLVLVACSNAGDGAGTGNDAQALTGVVWVLDDASISALVDQVPPGARVTVTFEGGQAHGTAACNSYGGGYRAGDDGSMSFDDLAVTEMACDEPLMTLEGAYLGALARMTGFEVDDTLRLAGGDVTLSFSRAAPPQPLSLAGPTWTLTSIFSGDAVSSVLSGTEVTAVFAADGTVSGSAGCNRFSGSYSVAGTQLSFSPLTATKMACAGYVMAQERVFLDAMSGVSSFVIDGEQLTLSDRSGAALLGFDGTAG